MSHTYEYPDKTTVPNLQGIHYDVSLSAMTDKDIEYCDWTDETVNVLEVVWARELSAGDKTILDGIVADNS